MTRISAGPILSKKRARDMTHTFELEPREEPGFFYLSSVKITLI
ncbi:MAG: hypothetical protein JWR43_64 [Phenylobacterium sp.]|nr:hypothetical protein [Phenylobacterium sp.]